MIDYNSNILRSAVILFIVGCLTIGFGFKYESIITGIVGCVFISVSFLLFKKYGNISNVINMRNRQLYNMRNRQTPRL